MSTTKKMKRVLTGNTTRETAETALLIFSASGKREQELQAMLDEEIAAARKKYDEELHQLSIQKLQAFETLQRYAENNRDAFGAKKSIQFPHGALGFRTGMPKLKTIKGYSWESVLQLLKKQLPGYVRTVEEPAKNRLLADRFLPEVQQKLQDMGICVEQEEVFFVVSQPAAQASVFA